jgi:hypothetical protein
MLRDAKYRYYAPIPTFPSTGKEFYNGICKVLLRGASGDENTMDTPQFACAAAPGVAVLRGSSLILSQSGVFHQEFSGKSSFTGAP